MVEMFELPNEVKDHPIERGATWLNTDNNTFYRYDGKKWVAVVEVGEPLQRS